MNELIAKAEQFVTEILENELPSDFTYHNIDHTINVVEGALLIGNEEGLSEEDLNILILAAWFHDIGFCDSIDDHETKSVLRATRFLVQEGIDMEIIENIADCILSTKRDFEPKQKIHRVLLDAGMYHLSKENRDQFGENLRKEWSLIYQRNYSDMEWNLLNLDFLKRHQFYTTYGKEILDHKKQLVTNEIQKKIKKLDKIMDSKLTYELGVTPAELKALKKKLKNAESRPEKGIETMFRLTSKNHIAISGMADSKANIMISINTIIISVLLGSLMQKLDSNPHLIPPTIILLAVTLSSIVYSILSLRPNITEGKFTRADIENQNTNLLFFGNFHNMKRDDYHWGMNRLMENSSFLYSSLIDDIFFLGIVLAKKYFYLRVAYNIFMYGITISVIAFIIVILSFDTMVL